jgi:hypothetical protein
MQAIAWRKDKRMNEAIPVRVRPAKAAVLALLIVLSLIVAPTCAPLCAAKICSSGTAQGQCHEMASTGADGSDRLVAPSKVCNTPDFSAVLVNADRLSLLSQGVRNTPEQSLVNRSSEQGLGSLYINPERWDAHRLPSKSVDSLLLTTILRI